MAIEVKEYVGPGSIEQSKELVGAPGKKETGKKTKATQKKGGKTKK